jgi:hypothetical protein
MDAMPDRRHEVISERSWLIGSGQVRPQVERRAEEERGELERERERRESERSTQSRS